MKKVFIAAVAALILFAGCRQMTPPASSDENAPPREKYHVDVPVEMELEHFTETVEATDVKGSGYKYNQDVGAVKLTSNRMLYDHLDFRNVDNECDDAKYYIIFMYLSMANVWEGEATDMEEFDFMGDWLLNSSLWPEAYSDSVAKKIDRAFETPEKKAELINRFFRGATAENGYTPDEPLAMIMREDAYSAQHSRIKKDDGTYKDVYIEKIFVTIPETGEEIYVYVYRDPDQGTWHFYGGSQNNLLKRAGE